MNLSITGVLILILGVATVATPWYVFPACQEFGQTMGSPGMTMLFPCDYGARVELGVGAVLALCGCLLLVAKTTEARRAVGAVSMALGVLTILLPTILIQMCMDPSSICKTGTEPALELLGALTVVVSLVAIVRKRTPATIMGQSTAAGSAQSLE